MFDDHSGSSTRLKKKVLLKALLQTWSIFVELGWRAVVTQILSKECSTSPVNVNRIFWAMSAASLPSEKDLEANLAKFIYVIKNFFIRLILILVSISLSGVHPQAGRSGPGIVPHITDTENPYCPQAVSCIYAPGGPPPLAFISPKCHWCWVLTLQWSQRYGLWMAFSCGCTGPRLFLSGTSFALNIRACSITERW